MTNPELESFLRSHHTVIVPTGATEQHGPHGPLLTDVFIPQEVARRAAPQLGAVVAPPINYALSYPHVGFTGVVHIRIQTFMALVEDLCAQRDAIEYRTYPGAGHDEVMAASSTDAAAWMAARLAGELAPSSCGDT